jgi:signal transduction histidine kinase
VTIGGGPVESAASAPSELLQVSIKDTGIGIRPEDHERIFREFEQVDSDSAHARQGTGLGLALTRRLVELHGGRLWAESAGLGQGTTFLFTLPVAGAAAAGRSGR